MTVYKTYKFLKENIMTKILKLFSVFLLLGTVVIVVGILARKNEQQHEEINRVSRNGVCWKTVRVWTYSYYFSKSSPKVKDHEVDCSSSFPKDVRLANPSSSNKKSDDFSKIIYYSSGSSMNMMVIP